MNYYNLSQLTVVILTYKTDRQFLINCLESISKNVKIIIVENSNEFKDEKNFLNRYQNLKVYCTGKNLGFGGGNNFGFKKINTKFALILSPDTICDQNFFVNISKYFNNKLDFTILGVNFYDEDIKKFGHKPYGYFKKSYNKNLYNNNLLDVDWVIGCAMIINLEKFQDKSVFDEKIFIYFEDFDLCKNVINKGQKVFSAKDLYIKHIGNSSSTAIKTNLQNDVSKFRHWHWRWSQFYFYRKNFGYFYAYKKSLSKLFKYLFLMILFKVFYNQKKYNKNKYSFLGLLSSIICRKSYLRIKN